MWGKNANTNYYQYNHLSNIHTLFLLFIFMGFSYLICFVYGKGGKPVKRKGSGKNERMAGGSRE